MNSNKPKRSRVTTGRVLSFIDDLLFTNNTSSVADSRTVQLTCLALRGIIQSILQEEETTQAFASLSPALNSTVYTPSVPAVWNQAPLERFPSVNQYQLPHPYRRPSPPLLSRTTGHLVSSPIDLGFLQAHQQVTTAAHSKQFIQCSRCCCSLRRLQLIQPRLVDLITR